MAGMNPHQMAQAGMNAQMAKQAAPSGGQQAMAPGLGGMMMPGMTGMQQQNRQMGGGQYPPNMM
jgi:hypothetical protein